jgi:hypothetical protein
VDTGDQTTPPTKRPSTDQLQQSRWNSTLASIMRSGEASYPYDASTGQSWTPPEPT